VSEDPKLLVAAVRRAVASGVLSGDLARTLRRWATVWRVPQLPDSLSFRHNTRLRTTIARWVIDANCLELSTGFFELRQDQLEILCHELAHAAVMHIHGKTVKPHGPEWRELVCRAGYKPRARRLADKSSTVPTSRTSSRSVYEHRCSVCQALRYGMVPVRKWRCAECVSLGLPGHLTIARVSRSAGAR
jgi:predicted SprT family Zn-dependent metalloprotease